MGKDWKVQKPSIFSVHDNPSRKNSLLLYFEKRHVKHPKSYVDDEIRLYIWMEKLHANFVFKQT